MIDFEDYYALLGINQQATDKEIKKAYIDKCYILHPDRFHGVPESAKKLAEHEMVRVNKAYEVLSDAKKRKAYDEKWVEQKNKPRPAIEPSKIQFKNVKPGEIRTSSFIIRNSGGPYNKIFIPNPETWVRLTKWNSLSTTDELPLQVDIEVEGPNTGKKFSEIIKVKLDNEEAHLPVVMQMSMMSNTLLFGIFKKRKASEGHDKNKRSNIHIPNWIKSLLFIISSLIIGLGISLLIGTNIPFWILLVFPIIYSAEKWFRYPLGKSKPIGKLYRLFLNICIVYVIGLLIWTGIKLFSKEFAPGALVGSFIFIAEFVFFIWLWRVIARNSWRWPSMKLTFFSLLLIFLVLAFAEVKPLSTYKDTALQNIGKWWDNTSINDKNTGAQTDDIDIHPISTQSIVHTQTSSLTSIPAPVNTTSPPQTKPAGIDSRSGVYKNYYLGLVKTPEGVSTGEDCYGEFIVLINNKDAKNPTYSELLSFLKQDKTDEFPYQYSLSLLGLYYGEAEDQIDLGRIQKIIDGVEEPDPPNICADFAERLHNNAEMAGIRCAYVSLDMVGYTDPYDFGIASDAGHACNAFETTDRGLVFIDCTGDSDNYGPANHDTIVVVEIGKEYNPDYLFPSGGWYIPKGLMGIVTDIFLTWDGEWR